MATRTAIPPGGVPHGEKMTMIVGILRHTAMTKIAAALRRAAATKTIRVTGGEAVGLATPKAIRKLLAVAGTTATMRRMSAAILRGGVANVYRGPIMAPFHIT